MVTKPPDTEALVPLRRNTNFQALWTSEAFAAVAKETAEFAYPLLILATTGSAFWAGVIASVQLAVAGLVSLPAGKLADRFDRKKLLITCNLIRVVLLGTLGLLIFADFVNIPLILGIAVTSAICLSISQPAGLAAIKALVPPAQLPTAISQNQIRFFGATLVGPPAAGALFGIARAFPYLGAAVSFLVSTLLLLFIKKPMQAADTLADDGKRHAIDGFRFIRRQPILFWSLFWIMGSNLVFNHTGVFIALAATATDEGTESAMIGVAVGFAGVGGLVGSFFASYALKKLTPTTIMMLAAWIGPVAATLMALFPNVVVMGVITGIVFLRGPIVSALFLAYVAVLAPDKLHGRVLGAVFFLSMIVQPIGIFSIGAIFDIGGAVATFTFVGAVALPVALTMFTPTMRKLPRPEELKETTL
ncbi:MFS transporter [Kibdelosporangium phytohabitans]|uniref:MFS transporter n=1 Tax=Kibdelosporangium phytohabitans TaxID=860235 RepID=A0A0N9I8W0_9PSEU|nr:MFS transporter [Kibdelosporangium phytohabitans]ALG10939.1 MFS transporter [Kibdelosporangium phytohabitans]MBE1462139.1 MFS family permease [Kibdelosporangium phytohabitans]